MKLQKSTSHVLITTLLSGSLALGPAVAQAGANSVMSHEAKEAAEHRELKRAKVRGEALLQQCVAVARQRVPLEEGRTIGVEYHRLLPLIADRTGRFDAQFSQAQSKFTKFSNPGQDRAQFALQWLKLRRQVEDLQPQSNLLSATGLESMFQRIQYDQTLFKHQNPGEYTAKAMKRIQALQPGPGQDRTQFELKRTVTLASLSQFEDSLVREASRISQSNELQRAEWNAHARPVAIALAGSAAFVTAVVYATPILAAGANIATTAGLAEGVGKVVGTGAVAAVGATGLEVLNKIAIPLWQEGVSESYRRNIPVSCALQKQIEIGKQKELEVVADGLIDGAVIGVGVAGITLIVPTVLRFLGGGAIRTAHQSLRATNYSKGLAKLRAGRFARWFGRQWDEVMLFTVAGAVGVGAIHELLEFRDSGHAYILFDKVRQRAEEQAKTARVSGQESLAESVEGIVRQLRSLQSKNLGEGSTHLVDLSVCAYLINHFAHGEFLIALEGELEEVIEVLATSADDAPTGINAAGSAVAKASKDAPEMTPLGLKLALINTKLEVLQRTKGALSPALVVGFAEMDHYIEMEDHELHDHVIKEAREKLERMASPAR